MSNTITLCFVPTATSQWRTARRSKNLVSNQFRNSEVLITKHSSFRDQLYIEKHAQKLKQFKHTLRNVSEDSLKGLNFIDDVQRLNIDYHFREEIEEFLDRQYVISSSHGEYGCNLSEVALCFRLLRQHGYNVPADVFDKFIDVEGKFNRELVEDIKGMMALHEASHLSIPGEDILDEAGQFSSQVLNQKLPYLDHNQGRLVRNTLQHPFHKSFAMFMARKFSVDLNERTNGLQEVAKVDFKLVQSIHQDELNQISKWWRDLGAKELKFARDEPLTWYMLSMGCLTDPSLSEERVELTKSISFIYTIDDIFDIYGTLDELNLFTEAVNRWDIDAIEHLPDYMKICFKALYDLTNQISYKVYQKHGWNPIDSLRKTWANMCNAFLVEAKWVASGKLPKADEYLKNGIMSSSAQIMLVHSFFLLGQDITKERVQILDRNPSIISSPATLLRLWDDLAGSNSKDEKEKEYDGSYVKYYMMENEGCSLERARKHVMSMISHEWKCLNQNYLLENQFPATFITTSLNFSRMLPLVFYHNEKQRLPDLEEFVQLLLGDSF